MIETLREIIQECETGPQPGMRQIVAMKAKRALGKAAGA